MEFRHFASAPFLEMPERARFVRCLKLIVSTLNHGMRPFRLRVSFRLNERLT